MKYNILHSMHLFFRKKKSTRRALINVVDYVSDSLDTLQYASGLLLDHQKVFHTVNYSSAKTRNLLRSWSLQ